MMLLLSVVLKQPIGIRWCSCAVSECMRANLFETGRLWHFQKASAEVTGKSKCTTSQNVRHGYQLVLYKNNQM